MIKHLRHQEIDKAKWDLCLSQSVNGLIYGYSWYLDKVSPNWSALVVDDYEAVFPLTHRKKIFRYLYQPFFTQQLGFFYKQEAHEDFLEAVLESIPKYFRFADIQLNEHNHPKESSVKVKYRKNFILDLNKPYQKLHKQFSNPTQRNIKKAYKCNLTLKPIDSDHAVDFYMKHKGKKTMGIHLNDYVVFKKLLKEVEHKNMLMSRGVFAEGGDLVGTALFYATPHRIYMINSCASDKGRALRSMYFMVDQLIHQFAEQPFLLDFEGSDTPGIAQFNKGFGAVKTTYPRLRFNRLPWWIKWMKG